MKFRNILFSIVTAIILTACASAPPPINLLPMYGYPEVEKPENLKKADEDFIRMAISEQGSREKAAKAYAMYGMGFAMKGDAESAMRRYNQSWLLNPNSYLPYWGFGDLLLAQGKAAEAATHYEKSLSLIDVESAKPNLLIDASGAYTAQGSSVTDKMKSAEFFNKANSLLNEAIKLDPKNGDAYIPWAKSLYLEGNYEKAWEMVKKSRSFPGKQVSPDFIDKLSKKMPEPK